MSGPAPTPQKAANYKREKVPLQKGFSLMDWNRLCLSGEDLSGTKGCLLRVTLSEVKKHNTIDDAWLVLNGRVFNVTKYMNYHPGGTQTLMRGVGRDCTRLFSNNFFQNTKKKKIKKLSNKFKPDLTHAWVNWESLLAKCYIGVLIPEPTGQSVADEDNETEEERIERLEDDKVAAVFPAPEGPQRASH